jgi:hypothetical protein
MNGDDDGVAGERRRIHHLKRLLEDGRLTRAWLDAAFPCGSLEAAWDACEDGRALAWMYAGTGDRTGLIMALAACVERLLPLVMPPAPYPAAAVRAARRVAMSPTAAGAEAALAAADDATAFTEEIANTSADGERAAGLTMLASEAAAALARVASVAEGEIAEWAWHCLDATAAAMARVAGAQASWVSPERTAAEEELARHCRARLPCPPLASVLRRWSGGVAVD